MAIDFERFQKLFRAPQEWILIEEAKRGDKEAFGRLYEIYLDKIYRYIFFQIGRKKEVAEDLAADVFMKAWTKLETFKEGSFQAWLYKIAKNTTIDYFRSSHPQVELEEWIAEDAEDMVDILGRSLDIQRVHQAMNKLTAEQKEVLLLKFVEDLSNAEISQMLGKQEDAIRAIQYRAIKELRGKLTDK